MITELKNPEFGRRSDETGGQNRNLEDRLFDITKSGTKKKNEEKWRQPKGLQHTIKQADTHVTEETKTGRKFI